MYLDNCLCLNIRDLVKFDLLVPDKATGNIFYWKTNDVERGNALVVVDMRSDEKFVLLKYNCGTVPQTQRIPLEFHASNLPNNRNGFYYFICPQTFRRCRKLYLYQGKFVSRSAIKLMYRSQSWDRSQKGVLQHVAALWQLESALLHPNRKLMYKGKWTRYGDHIKRLQRIVERTQKYVGQ